MNEKQRNRIRDRLLEERAERIEALTDMDDRLRERLELGDDDLSNYPLHPADDGTDTFEQEMEYLRASLEGRQLIRIHESLRTLYREPDTFGRCTDCGRQIDMKRLEMVPWSSRCIDCQNAAEEVGEEGKGGAVAG